MSDYLFIAGNLTKRILAMDMDDEVKQILIKKVANAVRESINEVNYKHTLEEQKKLELERINGND